MMKNRKYLKYIEYLSASVEGPVTYLTNIFCTLWQFLRLFQVANILHFTSSSLFLPGWCGSFQRKMGKKQM